MRAALSHHASFFLPGLLFLFSVAIPLGAQNPPTPPANASPAPQTPLVRSYTRLVQMNVVVTDKKGVPIPGLKKENFTVLDGKQPEQVAVFLPGSAALTGPAQHLPFNIFTNRFDALGQDPGSINIVLFDALNTSPTDLLMARKQLVKFLKTMKPGDRLAIYGLTTDQRLILHDFTSDSAALVGKVQEAETASSPDAFLNSLSATDSVWAGLNSIFNNGDTQYRAQQNTERVHSTCQALRLIADHVSGISGRKSLIWLSGGFPRELFLPNGGLQYDLDAEMKRTMEAMSRSDISVCPVDVHGVELTPGISPGSRSGPEQTVSLNNPFFARTSRIETFNYIAEQTGGQAFYGSNDLAGAARQAVEDGREGYTLGFYPTHSKWNGEFHPVKIQVNVPGAELRYRKGYIASAMGTPTQSFAEGEIQKAALSPLEATSLRLIVSVRHVTPPVANQLDFQVGADIGQLLLEHADGQWNGGIDLLFLQTGPTGALLGVEQKHIGFKLPDEQYEALLKSGAIYERHLDIVAETEIVRVVMRDSTTGIVGTVTIPLKAFLAGKSAPATAKDAKLPNS